jgi:CRISPR system Cascade subunit CasC
MVADVPRINVDAAVQVAHAISTHAVEGEFDYFTAVDDMNTSDETGAGMIGAIEFNSACLYRFASVGMHLLAENLSGSWDAAAAALELFLDGFALSMPSGYENSFAQKTRPALVAIVLREDQPVNLVSAFEAPVTGEEGVVDESIARLARALMDEERRWGDAPVMAAATWAEGSVTQRVDEVLREALGENLTFAELHVELRAGLSGLRV